MNMIEDSEISIVVQGPIIYKSGYNITNHTTKLVCQRLRKIFSKSEIILSISASYDSVANADDIANIIYDKLVYSPDPGASTFSYEGYDLPNNCNRLIVTSLEGIRAATKKYVFKIRSDLFVYSKSFLNYFDKYPFFDEKYKFVKNRIIAFSIYSVKSERLKGSILECPYHISDWAYFGYKQDLLSLFEIPLIKEPEFSDWYKTRPNPYQNLFPYRSWQMAPEQHITSSFFKKFIDLNFSNAYDVSNNNALLSAKLIANNFLVLDQHQFSLFSLKHLYLQIIFEPILANSALFFRTWLNDYHLYCEVPIGMQTYINRITIIYQKIRYFAFNILLRYLNRRWQLITRSLALFIRILS